MSPLWGREGAIIPVDIDDASLGLGTPDSKGARTILAWPGATPTTFAVHEADGTRLTVELKTLATGWSIALSAASARVILRVRAETAPAPVLGDGLTTTYDMARRTSIVRVPPHSGSVTITARSLRTHTIAASDFTNGRHASYDRRVTSVARTALVVGLSSLVLVATSCSTRQESPSAPAPIPVIASAAAAKEIAAPAPAPTVKLVGRFDTSDPAAMRFAWSGSMVVGRFKGTGISARLRDEGRNHFQVLVDGEPKAVIKTDHTKERYPLATGLSDGVHEVALYKRTEARVGEVAFLGFEPQGAMLPPPPAAERRMELIGDSITAGYGNEGPGAVCTFNPAEENQYVTYGAIAARALKAEHTTIAWSGKTIGEMTDYYERTLPDRRDSVWDFKAWTPQLVVMNIGTNNFATYDPGETKYVRIYTHLFDRVRKAYPQALIVCLLGPMLTDRYPPGKQNLTLARKYMSAAAAKIKASGETNFEYVELPEQKHSDGLGCGFHPSVKTHKLMADRVVAVAKQRLGW